MFIDYFITIQMVDELYANYFFKYFAESTTKGYRAIIVAEFWVTCLEYWHRSAGFEASRKGA
jgi:hypothetical protein